MHLYQPGGFKLKQKKQYLARKYFSQTKELINFENIWISSDSRIAHYSKQSKVGKSFQPWMENVKDDTFPVTKTKNKQLGRSHIKN